MKYLMPTGYNVPFPSLEFSLKELITRTSLRYEFDFYFHAWKDVACHQIILVATRILILFVRLVLTKFHIISKIKYISTHHINNWINHASICLRRRWRHSTSPKCSQERTTSIFLSRSSAILDVSNSLPVKHGTKTFAAQSIALSFADAQFRPLQSGTETIVRFHGIFVRFLFHRRLFIFHEKLHFQWRGRGNPYSSSSNPHWGEPLVQEGRLWQLSKKDYSNH